MSVKYDYTIGIDPSINSTGVVIQQRKDGKVIKENFYIIKGEKLTKKEKLAEEGISNFNYMIYNKIPITGIDDNHELELIKTTNFFQICTTIYDIIKDNLKDINNIKIVMEGISYGSTIRTKSVFDLAGLNYLIRKYIFSLRDDLFRKYNSFNFYVCTPSEIKKHVTGKGNANKDQMMSVFKILKSNMNLIPKLDDICDAWFMSEYSNIL